MRKLKLGELSAFVTGGPDGDGGGEGPLFVLLHGFGAPGSDLVPLAAELDVGREVRFLFPMAPLVLEPGAPDDFAARAWWMIDIAALQVAAYTQHYDALTEHEPDGLARAKAQLGGLLDAAERELGVSASRTLIGGFSQGAMLAADVAFTTERRFAGLAVLSGALINRVAWQAAFRARSSLPVFQSHGTSDPILPFAVAELLGQGLTAAGVELDRVTFPGGHGIPKVVLDRLSAFARKELGGAA